MFEVARSAIFLGQEGLTGVEFAWSAAGALGRVGAVVVRDMVVSNVAEPVMTSPVSVERRIWD